MAKGLRKQLDDILRKFHNEDYYDYKLVLVNKLTPRDFVQARQKIIKLILEAKKR